MSKVSINLDEMTAKRIGVVKIEKYKLVDLLEPVDKSK